MLSVTAANGSISYFPAALATSYGSLHLSAGSGPVTYDDVLDGEAYDGRVAQATKSWDSYHPPALVTATWEAAVKPAQSPADFGAEMSSHTLQTVRLRDYSVATAGGVEQPLPCVFVLNFTQNMAGIVSLHVRDCVRGSVIRLRFAETLWSENRTAHNQFPGGDRPGGMARMLSNYTCAGGGTDEVYRTHFTSFGFQYVQVTGYPGVPMPDALTAHFIGPDFAQAAEFTSSAVLNTIQSAIIASATANWANDVPSDCPHRERRDYLGDDQHAMETVVSNFWSARGYIKWFRDFRDPKKYDNATLDHQYDPAHPIEGFGHGHVGGVAPFASAQETDSAWGIATWLVPETVAEYYDDERLIHQMYPVRPLLADGAFDCGREQYRRLVLVWQVQRLWQHNTPAVEYVTVKTPYSYAIALERTGHFAEIVGNAADSRHYASLALDAQAAYVNTLWDAEFGCFGNCTYVNQIFGLSLPRKLLSGTEEVSAWANVLKALGPNASDSANANRFGGGIVTLKFVYTLFQEFGEATLALRTLLHTDRSPSLGYIATQDGTVLRSTSILHEAWSMKNAYTGKWVFPKPVVIKIVTWGHDSRQLSLCGRCALCSTARQAECWVCDSGRSASVGGGRRDAGKYSVSGGCGEHYPSQQCICINGYKLFSSCCVASCIHALHTINSLRI